MSDLFLSAATSTAGLFTSVASSYATKAQGFMQQAGYAAQANEDLRLAGLRADKAYEYAEINARRTALANDFQQINYKVAALKQFENLRQVNATARARAAANGVRYQEGSALTGRTQNVANTFRDVGLIDLSALAARVTGFEDVVNILKAGADSAFYERESAIANARTGLTAGAYASRSAGLMAGVQLVEGALGFAKTFPFQGFQSQGTMELGGGT
jgi:tetrahydromethanopterin S-methyltransferase subunit B